MKKFDFKLQKLLEYKKTVEEQRLAELAAVRAEHEREEMRLREFMGNRDMFRERMKDDLRCGSPEAHPPHRAVLDRL